MCSVRVIKKLNIMPLRLLFIAPKGKKDSKTNQKPLFHMAIGVLVSLTPDEHTIEIADEHFGDTINYDGDYDLVGITSRTIDATRAYEIADEFRRKGKKVILGGLLTSTFLNAFIIPIVYELMNRKKK